VWIILAIILFSLRGKGHTRIIWICNIVFVYVAVGTYHMM
jgi:hypothetical protein